MTMAAVVVAGGYGGGGGIILVIAVVTWQVVAVRAVRGGDGCLRIILCPQGRKLAEYHMPAASGGGAEGRWVGAAARLVLSRMC